MKCQLKGKDIKDNFFIEYLKGRGIKDINEFIEPSRNSLISYRLLDNIDKGREVLESSKLDTPILIVVDCDVDGYTSGAIMYQYLKDSGYQNLHYILHEHKTHGLEDVIDQIMDSEIDYKLVILPDSSSNDKIYHDRLAEVGIKCLVLDHHSVDDKDFSDNAIIINNQLSENYPNKALTGAGVTWQFCRYLDESWHTDNAEQYMDLAALGICGDMGTLLVPENNYIIKKGFSQIKNYFFKVLTDVQGYSMGYKVNPITVAFYVVPIINGMIRVGTQEEKQRLFLAFIDGKQKVISNKRGAKGQLEEVAVESARECGNARNKQNRIKDKVVEQLEAEIYKNDLLANKVLFLTIDNSIDYPSELNGLVAMKLSAQYNKPTIITREDDFGYLKGSIRGVNNSELTDFRQFLLNSSLFQYAQGHPQAAGCSIHKTNLDKFIEYANEQLKDYNFDESVYMVDFSKNAEDPSLGTLVEEIAENNGIWGTGIEEPVIHIHNLKLNQNDIQIIGKNQDTIKFNINGVDYIKFKAKEMIDKILQLNDFKLEIIGRANLNSWMGHNTYQIIIDDFEIKEINPIEELVRF